VESFPEHAGKQRIPDLALKETISFDYILARFHAVFIEIWAAQVLAGKGQVDVYLPPPATFLQTAII
jgi:hypothetical protein